MGTARRLQDVKAEAHRRHPELADPGRQAGARAELDAYIAGHHLKELRKATGETQAEVAQVLGVSQSRISQIEKGNIEAMRWRCAGISTSPSASDPTRSRWHSLIR